MRIRTTTRRLIAALGVTSVLLATAACAANSSGGSEPGSGSGAESETVTLRFSYFTSESNPIGQTWIAWMDEVTERSDGSIQFEAFWDGTLLAADAVVDGLRDGRADIAQITPSFYAGQFPLTSVNELPFGTNNMGAISAAMANLYAENEDLAEEWTSQGVTPVAWVVGGPSVIVSNVDITSVDDFNGLKIRGIDRGSRALRGAGANVMAVPPADLYSSLERGLLDASGGVQFGALPSFKLQEVADYAIDASLGAQTASALAMSTAGWNRLSEEQQRVITEVSKTVPELYAQKNFEAEAVACTAFADAGVKMLILPQAEVQKLRAAGEAAVVDEWVAEVEEAGFDGLAFRETYNAEVAAVLPDYADGDLSGLVRCIEGA